MVTQSGLTAPRARTHSPLAATVSAATAKNMHNINLHNLNLLVHILFKFNPLRRAISHLHSHSRTRSTDLRICTSTLNRVRRVSTACTPGGMQLGSHH